jgi:hypothetical protein
MVMAGAGHGKPPGSLARIDTRGALPVRRLRANDEPHGAGEHDAVNTS